MSLCQYRNMWNQTNKEIVPVQRKSGIKLTMSLCQYRKHVALNKPGGCAGTEKKWYQTNHQCVSTENMWH